MSTINRQGVENIVNLFQDKKGTRHFGGGSEPPMELSERVTRIETIIPTLSTKEDLVRESGLLRTDLAREIGGLRVEMHKEFSAQTWRIIGAMLTFGALLTSAVFFIARNVH